MTGHGGDGKARGWAALGTASFALVLAVLYMVARPDDDLRGGLDDDVVAGASTEPRAPQRVPDRASASPAPKEPERAAPPPQRPAKDTASSPAPFVPESATLAVRTISGGLYAPGVRVELSDGQTTRTGPRGEAVFRVLTTPPGEKLIVRAFRADGGVREARTSVHGDQYLPVHLDRRDRPLELTLVLAGEAAKVVFNALVAPEHVGDDGSSWLGPPEIVVFRDGIGSLSTDYDTVSIWIVADGFVPWRSERLYLPLDVDDATVTANLERGANVFGHVRAPRSTAVRELEIVLVPSEEAPAASLPERLRWDARRRSLGAILGARRKLKIDGLPEPYRFEGLARGRYVLQVRDEKRVLLCPPRIVTVLNGENVGPIDFDLPSGREIVVSTLTSGWVNLPLRVRLRPIDGPPSGTASGVLTAESLGEPLIVRDVPAGTYTLSLEPPPVPSWASLVSAEFARALAETLLAVQSAAAGRAAWTVTVEADRDPPEIGIVVIDYVAAWTARARAANSERPPADLAIDRCFDALLAAMPVEVRKEAEGTSDPRFELFHALIAIAHERDLAGFVSWISNHL